MKKKQSVRKFAVGGRVNNGAPEWSQPSEEDVRKMIGDRGTWEEHGYAPREVQPPLLERQMGALKNLPAAAPRQSAPAQTAGRVAPVPQPVSALPANYMRNEQTGEMTTFQSQTPPRGLPPGAIVRRDAQTPSPADEALSEYSRLIGKSDGGVGEAMVARGFMNKYQALKPFDLRKEEEQGAMSRVEREAELRRQAAGEERAYGLPEREARIGEAQARTKLLGTQEEVAQLGTVDAREYAHLTKILRTTGPEYTPEQRAAAKERLQDIEEKAMRQKIAIEAAKQKAIMGEDYADGGAVRGYADGGAIGRAQTQQLNPLVSQYGQYLQAAAQTGVAPVPFTQYINLLSSTRGAMNQTPTQFADGGDVSALSRPLEGPGTGKSDSIPAVIDGEQPAALSRGEFVIPEHVVRKKGTEFFEKLIAQYSEGVPANG